MSPVDERILRGIEHVVQGDRNNRVPAQRGLRLLPQLAESQEVGIYKPL